MYNNFLNNKDMKILGWIFILIAFLGCGQLILRNGLDIYMFLAFIFYIALGLICFQISKRKKNKKEESKACIKKTEGVKNEGKVDSITNESRNEQQHNVLTKEELIHLIKICDDIACFFRNSASLNRIGGGRSEKMYQIMMSYKCIFIYFYTKVFNYGKLFEFNMSPELSKRYEISENLVFSNPTSFSICLAQLPINWKDVLTVFSSLELAGEVSGERNLFDEVKTLGSALDKISSFRKTNQ